MWRLDAAASFGQGLMLDGLKLHELCFLLYKAHSFAPRLSTEALIAALSQATETSLLKVIAGLCRESVPFQL